MLRRLAASTCHTPSFLPKSSTEERAVETIRLFAEIIKDSYSSWSSDEPTTTLLNRIAKEALFRTMKGRH